MAGGSDTETLRAREQDFGERGLPAVKTTRPEMRGGLIIRTFGFTPAPWGPGMLP